MSKIIIGIHGLGNKPSKTMLKDWWKKSIIEGLNKYKYPIKQFEFELVYWADILHPVHLKTEENNRNNPFFLKDKYFPEQLLSTGEQYGFRQKAREYFDKFYGKIIVNEVLSLKYPSLTDFFVHLNMRELENYYVPNNDGSPHHTKVAMIERLTDVLKKHKYKKILLISHSMGSLISHDVLTEYLPDTEIDTLVTLGSPLGQKYVLNKTVEEQKKKGIIKLRVPENIKRNWYNLSDLEDQVALNHLLTELYAGNSRGVKIIDKIVQNNYINMGIRNPHTIYGYLRTPEFAEIVNSFLIPKRFFRLNWFKRKSIAANSKSA
jgi:hypothetical protein